MIGWRTRYDNGKHGSYLVNVPYPTHIWFYFLDLATNVGGALICIAYFHYFVFFADEKRIWSVAIPVTMAVILAGSGFLIQYGWKAKLLHTVRQVSQGVPVVREELLAARRRIINLPLFAGVISLTNWGIGALILSVIRFLHSPFEEQFWTAVQQGARVFFGVLLAGLVASTIVTFSLENLCRRIRPILFPYGDMDRVPGAIRFNLKPRLQLTFILTSVLPMLLLAIASYSRLKSAILEDSDKALRELFILICFTVSIGLASVWIISRLFASSILRPVQDIEKALKRIESGSLDVVLPVYAYDEFGLMMVQFNRMIHGLRDRYRMRQSLNMAMEVQRNLLPTAVPNIDGLDIGMASIYCDETGGDYLDFIEANEGTTGGLLIVVGDVSDHGISAALLMAATRAYLRMRCTMPGSLSEIITDLNRHLCRDIGVSGRFVTLFAARIHPQSDELVWCNAGHDPPMMLRIDRGDVEELRGDHLPLGIDDREVYREIRSEFRQGDLLTVFTDGVWEARNANGEYFGKDRLIQMIQTDAEGSVQQVLDRLIDKHRCFLGDRHQEDDITMLMVRRMSRSSV
ncbi:MAG: SpoIIE family protein phosphatase [Thermodesulfobacteriota bacterium]